jgi:hypothetical protein
MADDRISIRLDLTAPAVFDDASSRASVSVRDNDTDPIERHSAAPTSSAWSALLRENVPVAQRRRPTATTAAAANLSERQYVGQQHTVSITDATYRTLFWYVVDQLRPFGHTGRIEMLMHLWNLLATYWRTQRLEPPMAPLGKHTQGYDIDVEVQLERRLDMLSHTQLYEFLSYVGLIGRFAAHDWLAEMLIVHEFIARRGSNVSDVIALDKELAANAARIAGRDWRDLIRSA